MFSQQEGYLIKEQYQCKKQQDKYKNNKHNKRTTEKVKPVAAEAQDHIDNMSVTHVDCIFQLPKIATSTETISSFPVI